MGVVQVQLPDGLKRIIERQIAEGRAASEADYVVEAIRRYAEDLQVEDELIGMTERADADMAAGQYVTVSTPEDALAVHQGAMSRLRAGLAEDPAGH